DRDLVGAPRPLRWWLRDFVVYGAEVLIDFDRLKPDWRGVLQILDNPKAPSVIKGHGHWLADIRFRGGQLYLESVGNAHPFERLFWRESLGLYRVRTQKGQDKSREGEESHLQSNRFNKTRQSTSPQPGAGERSSVHGAILDFKYSRETLGPGLVRVR